MNTRLCLATDLPVVISWVSASPYARNMACWVQEQIQLTKALSEPLSQLQQTARNIAEISQECKLQIEPDEYVESFKPFSMDITYHWSKVCS